MMKEYKVKTTKNVKKNIKEILVVASLYLSIVLFPFINGFITNSYLWAPRIGILQVVWINKDYNYSLNIFLTVFSSVVLLLITVFLISTLRGKWKLISLYPFLQSISFMVESIYLKLDVYVTSRIATAMTFLGFHVIFILGLLLILILSAVPFEKKKIEFYRHPLAIYLLYTSIVVILPVMLSIWRITHGILLMYGDLNPSFNYIQSTTRGFIFAGSFLLISIFFLLLYKKEFRFISLFSFFTASLFMLQSIFLIYLSPNLSNAFLIRNFAVFFLLVSGIGLIWLTVQFYRRNYFSINVLISQFKDILRRKELN